MSHIVGMKTLVTKEDIDIIKKDYCDGIMSGAIGDGVTLHYWITMYRPEWIQDEPYRKGKFKQLKRWYYNDTQ